MTPNNNLEITTHKPPTSEGIDLQAAYSIFIRAWLRKQQAVRNVQPTVASKPIVHD